MMMIKLLVLLLVLVCVAAYSWVAYEMGKARHEEDCDDVDE